MGGCVWIGCVSGAVSGWCVWKLPTPRVVYGVGLLVDGGCIQSYSKKEGLQEESTIHKIRITLTSRNVKSLEKGV